MILSEKSKEIIKSALRDKFETLDISMEYITRNMREIIDTAYELGLIDFASELEEDLKTELNNY